MRRSEWVLGGVLGILIVFILAIMLFFFLNKNEISALEQNPDSNINNQSNPVIPVLGITARQAYMIAEPVARTWAEDAVLLAVRASWPPEQQFQDGLASWNIVFYSPGQSATASIAATGDNAAFLSSRKISGQFAPADLTTWQLDSPAAVESFLNFGARGFLEEQDKVMFILALEMQNGPIWKGTFADTEAQRTIYLNINATNGELLQ
jgi:hypothetical protein